MSDGHSDDDYVFFSSLTHPQGRARAFEDMWKALVRTMIEVNDNPVIAFAIHKTDRMVTADNMKLLSPEDLDEWEAACDEFEGMTADEQQAWIDTVLSTYPSMDELPEPEAYNDIN